jgi:hypothetical protein
MRAALVGSRTTEGMVRDGGWEKNQNSLQCIENCLCCVTSKKGIDQVRFPLSPLLCKLIAVLVTGNVIALYRPSTGRHPT